MVNSIKESADGLALQITKPARQAGLVTESAAGDVVDMAEVFVYGFDDLLMVVDANGVSDNDRALLVSLAARKSRSVYGGHRSAVTTAGNGYQVQLPGASDAGFSAGDTAPVHTAQGVLFILRDGRQRELVEQLVANRRHQADGGQVDDIEPVAGVGE